MTAVSGNTITATGRGGQKVSVQVSAATTYSRAGASITLADIHAGDTIAVRGTAATTGGVLNATAITIVLPSEGGVVTAVSGNTLTLTGFDGTAHTVTVSAATRYQKAGQDAALADVTTGTSIRVEGTSNSDGSLIAVRVTIQVPHLDGQVTAVNGTSYSVTGHEGTARTITATDSTVFVNADGTKATAAAVKVGVELMAEGTLSADGKTLTAQRVTIAPAEGNRGPGSGDHGGHGQDDSSGTSTSGSATSGGSSTTATTGTDSSQSI